MVLNAGRNWWGILMRILLEHDPIALAVLVFGIAAIELLAFSI